MFKFFILILAYPAYKKIHFTYSKSTPERGSKSAKFELTYFNGWPREPIFLLKPSSKRIIENHTLFHILKPCSIEIA